MSRAAEAGFEVDFEGLKEFSRTMEVHQHVVDAITSLRERGYRTAVVTNNVKEFGDRWRNLVALDDLFDVVVDSCHVGMRKPNTKIFLHTLDLMGGIAPERAVFLDDAAGNVDGARAAGLHAILVDDPEDAIRELEELLAAHRD
jgi:putative hydrolase of the HAD superfamily